LGGAGTLLLSQPFSFIGSQWVKTPRHGDPIE
jgi:hypothetical protein